ncbi:hypothetical protein [Fructobacillus evanidus]|uniref:Uncharacterized protein n=1 Tax=Fructobacillus evanidus TaxID=3064281 RepID=A0ABN9YQC9_9LACO|nr:unnamed protein product [Fructobacillus sp. LMG 32999]CAK1231635.1 unnamed protein product [Fructobacillus sp. LMG 32999]CAK1233005.1 unnamed protein product [Fructobacillus sp. LMG 32999]CAK1237005.1 unnamed protein product [Fructobacillus sp. LMG 32999]CAK1237536.1 unnamed protein product [Fructobacillus sp. LMG 32999]
MTLLKVGWSFLILLAYPITFLWAANHGWPTWLTLVAAFVLMLVGSLGFMAIAYGGYRQQELMDTHQDENVL